MKYKTLDVILLQWRLVKADDAIKGSFPFLESTVGSLQNQDNFEKSALAQELCSVNKVNKRFLVD